MKYSPYCEWSYRKKIRFRNVQIKVSLAFKRQRSLWGLLIFLRGVITIADQCANWPLKLNQQSDTYYIQSHDHRQNCHSDNQITVASPLPLLYSILQKSRLAGFTFHGSPKKTNIFKLYLNRSNFVVLWILNYILNQL